jgi:hypothetical protein
MKKQITLVNRHYPPNLNITGENAWDLANYLITKYNIEVSIVHIDRKYEGGGTKREPVGNCFPIKTIYQGKNKLIGYLSGFLDGYLLIQKAAKLKHGPIVVMTSPPMLSMWASLLLGKNNWILWSMDLFPEGFVAANQLSEEGFVYKKALQWTYKNYPSELIALGPQQKKFLDKQFNKEIESTILPCGVFVNQHKTAETPAWKKEPDKMYLGYVGSCGLAHFPEFVKAVIDCINPQTQHLVLAVYGIHADEIKKHAENKKGITFLPSIPRSELHHVDIHLVTLLNSWTHMAVPSKALSSICSGATILFCGNKESDNWFLLGEAGWLIEQNDRLKEQVKQTLASITMEEINEKKKKANEITKRLNQMVIDSYDKIATWAR